MKFRLREIFSRDHGCVKMIAKEEKKGNINF